MRPVYFFSALLGLLFLAVQACSAAPIFIKDDLGRTIRLDHAPQRIVSLEPSVTEVLYAVGAGDKIVADDLYSDYPAAAKLKVHVNGVGPSRELLLGLKPDLVILFDQTFTIQKADNWQRMYGVPVYVTNAGTYRGVEADIQHLGAFAGNKQLTDAVIAAMDHAVNLVTRAVANRPKRKAFVVIWNTPLMTAGRGTFIDDLIRLAGGIDVASATAVGYPTYSPEMLVGDDPDVLLTGTTGNTTQRIPDRTLQSLNLRAIKNGSCFEIPDDWTVRPGPRLALGLTAVAKVLHPECFAR